MSDSIRLADRSPLPTVPAQSALEKRLHRDPEYCALIRATVAGMREYRERGRPTTPLERKQVQAAEESRKPRKTEVWHTKRVSARALVEQEGWTPGTWLASKRWSKGPRQLLEIAQDGVWITEGEHENYAGKRHMVHTLPMDARAVEGCDR